LLLLGREGRERHVLVGVLAAARRTQPVELFSDVVPAKATYLRVVTIERGRELCLVSLPGSRRRMV